ncbi:MAG TPA: HlyD family efflux transporter periplasmic adaptor subunit [Chloroflexi bacterium]|nr:HlyD family efflux transporter periplasmic adaptor subunit [Chloroflexota bacterium]
MHKYALLVVLIALLTGCGQATPSTVPEAYTPPPRSSPNPGSTAVVQRGNIVETVEARGRVVSASEALLSFELEGVLTAVYVNPGDQVATGDLLAEIQSRDREGRTSEEQIADAQYQVNVAQINLEAAYNELAMAEADVKVCQEDVARAEAALHRAQYDYQMASYQEQPNKPVEQESDYTRAQRWALEFSSVDYDRAVAVCKIREAKVAYQWTRVSLAEQDLAHARDLRARADGRAQQVQLLAPSSGIIISWEKGVGEEVQPFDPIGAVADPSILRLEGWVSEEDVAKVAPGQPVEVFLDLRPDESLQGKVVDVASESTVWQGRNVYVVDVEFVDGEGVPATIRTGADLVIETRSRLGVPLVPNAALFTEGDSYYVEVVRDGGRAKVEVQVGISDGTSTEILAGLVGGEELVVP